MFNRVLIANRGEIARRIIKTCRKLGIQTVAVYSSADKHSLHVYEADSAFYIGEAPSQESYLNIQNIINAAKLSGAEAVHPGYGFLSESALFAQACMEANIVFIGPPIEAIEIMASKQLAKQALEKTNVPLIPGYHGSEQQDDKLFNEAKKMGFPVLLKAAHGGGGKGMRAVDKEADFFKELTSARREAKASFANDTMLIEKLLIDPRHIEVQVLADNHGNFFHLFERDCSIQRRHQKVIEEAPAPDLPQTLRHSLLEAAITVAKSIDYRGVGTIEFLVANEEFYFMEMNTRLQVEHPVTEMITSLDLVELQLKVAANEPLDFSQDEIISKGHSIECRIYAEDPSNQFIPSIGQITALNEPQGKGIRVDSAVIKGSLISPYYDAMIAKLITWGKDRNEALGRLKFALRNYKIGGIKTNIPFLQAICENQNFRIGNFGTHFLQQETLSFEVNEYELALVFAASYDYLKLNKKNTDEIYHQCFGWQMHLPSEWSCRYITPKGTEKQLLITPIDSKLFKIKALENNEKNVGWKISAELKNDTLWINDGEQLLQAFVENNEGADSLIIHLTKGPVEIIRFNWQSFNSLSSKKGGLIAPMPATIVSILKDKGAEIKTGDCLMILEAMKMEHSIYAPRDGILTELFYQVGDQVNEGAELLILNND